MPPGLRTCLPRGWVPSSVGSKTPTISSCSPPGLRASVMSKREAVVAAAVGAQLLAVDPDGGLPVDGAEVEQQPPARATSRGTCERPAIPEPVGVLHHAREGRLDRERDQDLLGRASCPAAAAPPALPKASCQRPLRLSQSSRTSCGRGYSGGPGRAGRPWPSASPAGPSPAASRRPATGPSRPSGPSPCRGGSSISMTSACSRSHDAASWWVLFPRTGSTRR